MMHHDKKTALLLVFLFMFIFYIYLALPSVISWGQLNNYRNFSVRTTVNITDAMPEIINITCNSGASITLNPGGVQNVTCIIVLRDFNGGDTINGTNDSGVNQTTFYYYQNLSSDPDDNNTHYTNTTCSLNSTAYGSVSEYINWSCGFYPLYYANNGTWIANVSVHDRYNNKSYNVSSTRNATISPLYALNVTDIINFGDMGVGETSQTSIQANVTNFGNMNINISLYGYGAENTTLSSLAMVCSIRNITIANERYAIDSSLPWSSMVALSGVATRVANLTILQQQDDSQPVINATYWRLYVDPTNNPFGQCNGTVIYSAFSPG